MIFSATIPEQLSIFAQVGLRDYRYVKLDREYSLPDNMLVNFLIVGSDQKLSALIFLLQRFADTEQSIIFASTKYLVDLIVYTLERVGIQAVSVYGKMDQYDRREQLQQVLPPLSLVPQPKLQNPRSH
jgi:superfamily II DNA/RNA helicase